MTNREIKKIYLDGFGLNTNWQETFAWIPRRTITNKRIWLKKLYHRRVWAAYEHIGQNYKLEVLDQYGTAFDILKCEYDTETS